MSWVILTYVYISIIVIKLLYKCMNFDVDLFIVLYFHRKFTTGSYKIYIFSVSRKKTKNVFEESY